MGNTYDKITAGFLGIDDSSLRTKANLRAVIDKLYWEIITNTDKDPLIITINKILSKVENVRHRLYVASELESMLMSYYRQRYTDEKDIIQIEKEYKSLLHYLGIIDDLVKQDSKLEEMYINNPNPNRTRLDSLVYHTILRRSSYQNEFLLYSQALFHFAHIEKDTSMNSNNLPIYAGLFENRIVAYPAYPFCQSLIETQSYIDRVFPNKSGEPLTSVKSFPIKLRNYCFDQYINIRAEEELEILRLNNERLHEAQERDAKIALLRKESIVFDEMQFDTDCNPEAIHMAEFLINFLKEDLGEYEEEDNTIVPVLEHEKAQRSTKDIEKRIKAVYRKAICKHQADWGVIMRLMAEMGVCTKTNYKAVADRINKACGTIVTTPSALQQSHALSDISGRWETGWEDKAHTRQSANLLNHYNDVADIFMK